MKKIIIEEDEPDDGVIILYLKHPVEEIMEEVRKCRENEQQL